jgi:PAS domain S-box-containing protein
MLEVEKQGLANISLRLAVSCLVVTAGFLLRQLAVYRFGIELPPFITLFPSVMVAALLGGLWPGLVATAFSALLVDYFVFPPTGHFAISNTSQALSVLVFVAMGVLISVFTERYHHSERRVVILTAERAEREAGERLEQVVSHQRAMLTNMQEGFASCEMIYGVAGEPVDYKIVEVNQAYERQTGLQADQVVGKTILELFPDLERSWIEKFGTVATSGVPLHFEEFNHNTGRNYETFAYSTAKGKFSLLIRDITERLEAEGKLKENARLLSLALEASDSGFFDWDLKSQTASWSPELERLFGIEPGTFTGSVEQWRAWVLPEDLAVRDGYSRMAVETGELNGEWRIVRQSDREIRWISGHGRVLYDNSGMPSHLVGINVDITARKQAEEEKRNLLAAAQEERDRLSAVVNSINDEIWFADTEKRYRLANPAALREFGQGLDSLDDVERLAGSVEVYRPDYTRRPVEEAPPLRALKGEIVKDQAEIVRSPSTGTLRHRQVSAAPVRDAAGTIIGSVSVVRDVTERRQAEEALQLSQVRLAAIIGSAMDAVITISADQTILVFNAAAEKIFGCSAADSIGQSIVRFIPAAFREAHQGHVRAFAESGISSRSMFSPAILSAVRADGEEFPIEATISQVRVGEEKLYTVILRDVTERKQSEKALMRSEKLATVGRMAATIAHEINNPLAAVTNMLFLLQGMPEMTDQARQFLGMADAELKRIAHITRQSLGFYRENDTPSMVSVTSVLESALDLMKSKIAQKKATIHKDWTEDVEVFALPGELRQIFSNLIGNSLDAMGEGGAIRLRAVAGSTGKVGCPCVRVTIADNGRGIDKAAAERIFEPFFTTKGALGTGLGLWVTRQIVEKHHGTIRMRSITSGPHRGTSFMVILPHQAREDDTTPLELAAQSAL